MNNAILIHGTCDKEEYFDRKYPSLSNSHWFPWLQKQLIIRGINAQTPEMPDAYDPDYKGWSEELERYSINESTILVGHSCGGGFILRWLTENKVKVGKVVLVAPWLDPDRTKAKNFFEFSIDPALLSRIPNFKILVSNNDEQDVLTSVQLIRSAIPEVSIQVLDGLGHFTEEDMKRKEFPELLEVFV